MRAKKPCDPIPAKTRPPAAEMKRPGDQRLVARRQPRSDEPADIHRLQPNVLAGKDVVEKVVAPRVRLCKFVRDLFFRVGGISNLAEKSEGKLLQVESDRAWRGGD